MKKGMILRLSLMGLFFFMLTGCVYSRGPSPDMPEAYRSISETRSLSEADLARFRKELAEREGVAGGLTHISLERSMAWFPFLYSMEGQAVYVREGLWGTGSHLPVGGDAIDPIGSFVTEDSRSIGPFGVPYIRRGAAAFSGFDGSNTAHIVNRFVFWGALWMDSQTRQPKEPWSGVRQQEYTSAHASGIIWTAFGFGRKDARYFVRLLWVSIPVYGSKKPS